MLFIPTSPSLTSVCDLTGLYQPQRDRRASLVPQGPRGREMGGGVLSAEAQTLIPALSPTQLYLRTRHEHSLPTAPLSDPP